MALDPNTLAPRYKEIYELIDGKSTEEAIDTIWLQLGGQSISLPDHKYQRNAAAQAIQDKVRRGEEIDVFEESKFWGYSRRWVRDTIRRTELEK